MATVLLAPSHENDISAEQVLSDGESANVFMVPEEGETVPSLVSVDVQFKTAANTWVNQYQLGGGQTAIVVTGPITFRVKRVKSFESWMEIVKVGVQRG